MGWKHKLAVVALLMAVSGIVMAAGDYDGIETDNFRFSAPSVNDYLEANAFKDPAKLTPRERFRYDYYTRDWKAVASTLKNMGSYRSKSVYSRLLDEITKGGRPVLSVDDYIGLLRACPQKPTPPWMKKLGLVAHAVVLPEECPRLAAALRSGMPFFGGKEAAARTRAGVVMMNASFNKIAAEFLPSALALDAIKDPSLREEVVHFKEKVDKKTTADSRKVFDEWNAYRMRLLKNLPNKDGQAFHELGQMVGHGVTADMVASLIFAVRQQSPELAGSFAMLVVKKMGNDQRNSYDSELRLRNLELGQNLMQLLAQKLDLGKRPWRMLADAMADVWLGESARSMRDQAEYEKRTNCGRWKHFVAADDLLRVAPAGVWLAALSQETSRRVEYCIPKLSMYSSNPDSSVKAIIKLAQHDEAAAAIIAGDYLNHWAAMHDPVIPYTIIHRYNLKPGAAILVTPMMTSRNVADLAEMVGLLRKHGIAPSDSRKVMQAFQKCYGSSEIYRREHIAKVFGPPEQMHEELFAELIQEMADGLGERWRKGAENKANLNPTPRNNPLPVIRRAYGDTIALVEAWAPQHPDGWRPLTLAGLVLNDWADFELYQQMAPVPMSQRLRLYNEKIAKSHEFFVRGAEAYARVVPKLSGADLSADAYFAWFNSLLGLNMSGEFNLSKGINRGAVEEIRQHINALPQKYVLPHIKLFAADVMKVANDKRSPLPAELRYRYSLAALMVVKATPFGSELGRQQKYFDQLLSEARLKTSIDGQSTVCRNGEFGLIVSLVHSTALGDQINFEKYVTPQPKHKNGGRYKKMQFYQKARNEFEESIYRNLTPFFDIRSVTFSAKDVQPREIEKEGWQETVLAYVVLRPKGISVDRIPSLDLKLNFMDEDGPVSLPVVSPETMLAVVEKGGAPRPCSNLDVTQTLDTRRLYKDGILVLEIKVAGNGLIPEIDKFMNIAPLRNCLKIEKITSQDGNVVKHLYSWGEKIEVVSERDWRIVLDSKPVVAHPELPFEFSYPLALSTNTPVHNKYYVDVDLVDAKGDKISLIKPSSAGNTASRGWTARHGSLLAALVVLLIVVVVQVVIAVRRSRGNASVRDSAFVMPEELDAFAVVSLLRKIAADSDQLSSEQKALLTENITALEKQAFDPSGQGLPEGDLRSIAEKWLHQA